MTVRPKTRWRPPLALLIGGTLAVVAALPLLGMTAVVLVRREPGELARSLFDNWPLIVIALILIAIATALVGYAFWRGLTAPLERLNANAEAVTARGEPFDAPGPFGTRELARLGASFAASVDAVQRRPRTIETFSTHLVHELKSPLTGIRGAAELMRDEEMNAAQRERFLANIIDDANRLSSLVARLRELARADLGSGSDTARASVEAATERLDSDSLALTVEVPRGMTVPLTDEALGIALQHLADNARRHGAHALVFRGAGGTLTVENDGAPIAKGNRHRVLEPFFTTRRESGGTGMGLAIVRALIEQAGGTLNLESADPVRFALRFDASE